MKLKILWVKSIILNLLSLIIYNDHKCFVEIQTFKTGNSCMEISNFKLSNFNYLIIVINF